MRSTQSAVAAAVVLLSGLARAQTPQAPQPPPAQNQPPPGRYDLPPGPSYGESTTGDEEAPAKAVSVAPAERPEGLAPISTVPQAPVLPTTHAPKHSLWTGARVSYVAFGFSFYTNDEGKPETTGNLIGNGVAPEVDLGIRLAYRFVPYIFWEHAFLSAGHRFDGTDASASSDFYGLGFRFSSGDADTVSFLTDISIGRRAVSVRNGGQTYTMYGFEIFKIGLGAEIRLTTLLVVSPLLSLSGGSLTDTEGTVRFKDGVTEPRFRNGATIGDTRAYVVVSLGLGLHFDLFGR